MVADRTLQRELILQASDRQAGMAATAGRVLALAGELVPSEFGAVMVTLGATNAFVTSGPSMSREAIEAWVARSDHAFDRARTSQAGRSSCNAGACLLPTAQAALDMPILDRTIVLGRIHLESSDAHVYSAAHKQLIERLLATAVPALRRAILVEGMRQQAAGPQMIGTSRGLLRLEHQLLLAAQHAAPVLVLGERGAGKELAARAVHAFSRRRAGPFVPMLMSAVPESLFVDEMFGHERYAFTNAAQARAGKFAAADGGTLFLDEVGDVPAPMQSALLRAVEGGEVPRIGRDRPLQVDVRVVSATNRPLQDLIALDRFRQDLYDRLSVFEVRVPPLRERREDILLLARHFLDLYGCAARDGGASEAPSYEITEDFREALTSYDWPGNIRELSTVMLRAVTFGGGGPLTRRELPTAFAHPAESRTSAPTNHASLPLPLAAAMRAHIEYVLRVAGNNQSRAAALLGTPLSTLRHKMRSLGIRLESLRQGRRAEAGATMASHDVGQGQH